jgi:peptidoglycan-associated lipoprotein
LENNINAMRIAQRLILTCLTLVLAIAVSAQSKYTEDADSQYNREGYHEAAEAYKRVYPKINTIEEKGRVLFRIGECYRLMKDCAGAEEWYKKAITAKYYKTNNDLYFNYAESLREQGKFDEAVVQFQKYLERGGDKGLANGRIKDCENAAMMIDEPPTRYLVENEIVLNSGQFDYSPVFSSKKDDELVFSTSRQAAVGSGDDPITGESFMDLFTSARDKKGKWSTPTPLNNTVNTVSNEGAAAFNKKANNMYFTRCIYTKKGNFACDIYSVKKQGKDYGVSELIPIIDRECDGCNDSSQVGHPTLTPDDMNMIFASDMPGGYGGKDLWYIAFDRKAKTWGKPKNLGDKVNTTGDEMFPFVNENGTLYYSSNGLSGLGGLDIFSAENVGEMQWENPTNLQYPINSSSEDFGIIFEGAKDQGFFSSNRPGGKGKDDIYSFKMPPLEFCLKATVYDFDSGNPIADAKVIVQGTDGSSYEILTDGNGGFALCEGQIIAETNYSVDVAKDGYIGTGDQFSTIGLAESTTFAREYFLQPIILDTEYDLPLVLYPFDKSELLINDEVNSADSLNYLYDLLSRNPTFVIQLEAHTDTRGASDYNQNLSQRRAETCVNYLITKGIHPQRMKPVGFGKSQPIITDKEINAMATEEEQEFAHQVNRRTVFKIVSYDFVAPDNN